MTRLRPIVVFTAFLLLYFATAGGHLYSPDEEIMFRTAESIATGGGLSVEPILGPDGSSFATARGTSGREYAQYGLGNPLVAVPFVWMGSALTWVVPDKSAAELLDFRTVEYLPRTGPGRGHDLLRRFVVSFLGAVIGAATCALLAAFGARCATRMLAHPDEPFHGEEVAASMVGRAAWLTAIAYGAGTMAWPHARTFFSEPLATFFILLAFFIGHGGDSLTPRRAFACGTAVALALLTRLDSAIVAPAVGLYLLLRYLEERHGPMGGMIGVPAAAIVSDLRQRRLWSGIAAFLAAPVLFGLFYLVMNRVFFGSFTNSAYADQLEGIEFSTPLLAGLYGFLLSAGKSIFLFSPAIILGLSGWRAFARRQGALGIALTVAIALKILVHARWQNWAGGWCWGPRHIFMVHALLVLPAVAFFLKWNRVRRLVTVGIMVAAVAVQLYGTSQSFIDFHILYYRTPETLPQAYVMYALDDTTPGIVRMEKASPDGRVVSLSPFALPAPLNDSIYVPQNSQWYRYAEMARLGYTDNLWLRLLRRADDIERPIE